MQPYIFPYIGYYQLLNAVDTFVILDDVNFIMRGWINRNNIVVNGKPFLFSLPLKNASQNNYIQHAQLAFDEKGKNKFLKTFHMAYKKAPYFDAFYPFLQDIILFPEEDLTSYIHNSLTKTLQYLDIKKNILRSSRIEKDNTLKAEARIIEICRKTDTDLYINPSGGKSLYQKEDFEKHNITLKFINTVFDDIKYKQFNDNYISNLSFLDILMFNSTEQIKTYLGKYTLND